MWQTTARRLEGAAYGYLIVTTVYHLLRIKLGSRRNGGAPLSI